MPIDYLTIGDLDIRPYKYDETLYDGILDIEAKALLLEAQHETLKRLLRSGEYLSVIRHGISDEPKKMRFGPVCWSEHTEGIKWQISLVEEEPGWDGPTLSTALPWVTPLQRIVAENTGNLEALLAILLSKGVINTEDMKQIRADASAGIQDRVDDFFRVDDVDDF